VPAKNEDLHGNVPDRCAVVLLLIDVINDLEFDTGAQLLTHALPTARRLAALKRRAKDAGVPVIYANDNFGRWRSDFASLVAHCMDDDVRGKPIVELLRPEADDYFVLKPKHSAFFYTTLEVLLSYLGARTLILTGFTSDSCVLFTAHDAYMRDFHLVIPSDCVASADADRSEAALAQMERSLKADIRGSTTIDFEGLCGSPVAGKP
jgi:nicotinamidase-related amidase